MSWFESAMSHIHKHSSLQLRQIHRASSGGSSGVSQATIDDLAKRVIDGEFGNGEARKKALGKHYDAVQKRVNELLRK